MDAPIIAFKCVEGEKCRRIEEQELMDALSTGEQRAYYILHLIFEIQARNKTKSQTLLILDDIADSFDYKNKYAIIEYLKDIQELNDFFLIILTHNFDFFRTVQNRLQIKQKQCLMGYRTDTGIQLIPAPNKNPFIQWKQNLNENNIMLIASIPMVRNLIEYGIGKENNADYNKLTALLHQMKNTDKITMKEIAIIYNKYLGAKLKSSETKIKPLILKQADACLGKSDSGNLENKVVLSMAIRLTAEHAMIDKIDEPTLIKKINTNQTIALYKIYKEKFKKDHENIELLERVVLMTPEIIHLNSFMYEPIIDLSDDHLKKLYKEIKIFAKKKRPSIYA